MNLPRLSLLWFLKGPILTICLLFMANTCQLVKAAVISSKALKRAFKSLKKSSRLSLLRLGD